MRGDPAIAAGKYGPAGRRHPGAARPRLDSGIHGRSDSVRHFSRLSEHAEIRRGIENLDNYIRKIRPRTGWWNNFDKYIVSLLQGLLRRSRHPENEFGFNWLPRVTGDHSHQGYWLDMLDGKMDGLFVMGQNPAVAGPNSGMERRALGKLKWLVVREMVETETASFWYESPEVQRGELRTEDIETEVFFLPAAGHAEKDGTFTNTQRLLQWREKAVEPPGDCRSENWFVFHLGRAAEGESRKIRARAMLDCARLRGITTSKASIANPSPKKSSRKSTATPSPTEAGSRLHRTESGRIDGLRLLDLFRRFSQARPESRERTQLQRFHGHGWGLAWPSDRRILYNRASARPDGKPWSERKKLVWWDAEAKKWTGDDVPDFAATKPPDYQPPEDAVGDAAFAGDKPFILHADGFGWIWVPVGLNDGPLPTHYEPLESPVRNPLYPEQAIESCSRTRDAPGQRIRDVRRTHDFRTC